MGRGLADRPPTWLCNPAATLAFTVKVQLPKDITMKKIIALTIVAAALAVSACNTVAGAGRDVSATGRAVTTTAEEAKN
jgi:predicted small secreted protein